MRRLSAVMLVLAIVAVAGIAWAADKPNPTGTWSWTVTFGQREMTQTLKLKLEGDKLTGAVIGRNDQETAIEDAKYKDGELSFAVTRERNGQKSTTKYSGKVSGDTIKGKVERPARGGGEATTTDWEAKRVVEKKAEDKKT
jgi:hypothetical protein